MTRAESKAAPTADDAPRARLVLRPAHLAKMERHAREAYPAECCGIIIGRRGEHAIRVSAVRPAANRRAQLARDRYEIDPREILACERAAAQERLEVVGFYHSHPDHPARPSATDVAQAWPQYVYVIVGVRAGENGGVTAWTYDEERGRFVEHEMAVRPDIGRGLGAWERSPRATLDRRQ